MSSTDSPDSPKASAVGTRREPLLWGNISFRYPPYPGLESPPLFEDLRIELAAGQILVVLGLPDSGKTTLARILAGLIPGHTGGEFSGEVLWKGRPVGRLEPREMLTAGGLLFQDPLEQIISPRCDGEAAFALESLGMPPEEMRTRVARSLSWMDLSGFDGRNPAELSGGEQKRLLAAALAAQDPEFWILDEVFEELDARARRRLLSDLAGEGKALLIFASKYFSFFDDHSPDVTILRGGSLEPLKEKGERRKARLREEGFLPPLPAEPGRFFPGFPRGESSGEVKKARETLLAFDGLEYRAAEGGFVLEAGSLEIAAGEILAVLGPNGSGKTTLAKLLCGLLAPFAGEIRIPSAGGFEMENRGLKTAGRRELRNYCSYVFQNPDYQLFLPTIQEELLYGTPKKDRSRVLEEIETLARDFGLPPLEAPPALLSFGSRKRIQCAIAGLLSRRVLILDEADSGLSFRDFLEIVRRLKGEDRALVLITHQEELARGLADTLVFLHRGRVTGVER